MKILIISNPIASSGKSKRLARKLSSILKKRGHEVETFLTRLAGDAEVRAAQVVRDIDRVVVVGGDGTLNEVLNGLPEALNVPFTQLPAGNANLLAAELCLPEKPAGTADLIERGEVLRADYGLMNGRKFIAVASAGFDAMVTEEVKRIRKSKLGNVGYILPVLRALRRQRTQKIEVTVDGEQHAEGAIVIIGNVRNYAGFIHIAYDARIDSGKLDAVVFPSDSIDAMLKYAALAKWSRVTKIPGVHYLKGTRINIRSEEPVPVQMDGDYFGCTPVDIVLHPRRVSLLVPLSK